MKTLKYLKINLLIILCGFMTATFAQQNTVTDENITERVETEMAWQRDIPADQINVETKSSIVLLSGSVNNVLARDRAASLAGAVRGVRGVVNEIKVDPPEMDDGVLRDNIKNALFEDPAADSYEVDVKVDDGKVTLTGTVQSWQEKNLSEYVAKGVKGVKSVQNDIQLDFSLQRPDNEIKREIEQALKTDIRLYPNTVEVSVNNGEVKLSGYIGNVNARNLAKSYAWTTGVSGVDSDALEIESWAANSNLRKEAIPAITDPEIKEAVKDAFLFDPRVFSFKPDVTVDNGIVTLSGRVDNLKAKKAAAADAKNVTGVVMVKNNLKVRPDFIPSNSVLITRVQNALDRNPDVDEYEIVVAAWNGKVYLNGDVDTYYEKNKAEDIASNVKGVVDVVNNLGVYFYDDNDYLYPYASGSYYYPTPYGSPSQYYTYPLTDLQIQENIEDELWWSPFVNEFDVAVQVTSGVATLSGEVDSWQEQQAAIENAYEGGAISVVDNLTIDYGMNN